MSESIVGSSNSMPKGEPSVMLARLLANTDNGPITDYLVGQIGSSSRVERMEAIRSLIEAIAEAMNNGERQLPLAGQQHEPATTGFIVGTEGKMGGNIDGGVRQRLVELIRSKGDVAGMETIGDGFSAGYEVKMLASDNDGDDNVK